MINHALKCPEQIDSISCGLHVVHNAEVLMREGAAESLRKAAQVSRSRFHAPHHALTVHNGAESNKNEPF